MRRSHRQLANWGGLAVALLLALAAIAVLPPVLIPDVQTTGDEDERAVAALQTDRLQARNSARAGILQTVAGIVLAAGAVATWRNLRVVQEGQVTERYTRAIDQLGSEDASVRAGGIYALERIAHDSDRDRATIVEVLVAFVSRHATFHSGFDVTDETETKRTVQSLGSREPHLQAAMTVLGRLAQPGEIVLAYTNLTGANLTGADLTLADLTRANLTDADLTGANLTEARLTYAKLTDATLALANLTDVKLRGAYLARADLAGADLARADLARVNLARADLSSANITGTRANLTYVKLTGADLTRANLADADLTGADLTGADLTRAKLARAQLTRASLTDADLTGADLTDADLTDADLTGAVLPNDFTPPPAARFD